MADVISNIARGQIHTYHENVRNGSPAASALVIVPLEAVEADDTVRDYDDLGALLGAAGNTEKTTGGAARLTFQTTDLTAPDVDDTANDLDLDIIDFDFGVIDAGNDFVALILCYDADTGAGTDANIIPLGKFDFAVTVDGTQVVGQINANGYYRSQDAA